MRWQLRYRNRFRTSRLGCSGIVKESGNALGAVLPISSSLGGFRWNDGQ